MGMDKYGYFMQYMFIISETIVNMVRRHFSKVIDVFQRTSKETPGSYYFSFFALSYLLTQTCLHFCTQASSLLLNMQNAHLLFINTFVSHSVPTYCILTAAKFSIKLFSFIYFTPSVVRQRDEY